MFVLAATTMASLFLCIFVGFVCAKRGIIDEVAIDKLNQLLLNVAFPFMLLSIFNIELTEQIVKAGPYLCLYGFIYLTILAILGYVFIKIFRVSGDLKKIMLFSFIFTNTGFVGLPLIGSVLGSDGLLYASLLNIPFNIVCFSFGIYIIQPDGQNHISLKKIIASPTMIGIWCGLALLLSQAIVPGTFIVGEHAVRLPGFLTKTVNMIGAIASPLAMIIVGASLEQTKFKRVFKDVRLHIFAFLRLIIAPLIVYLLLQNIINDPMILIIVTVFSGLPTATMAATFAEQFKHDYVFTSEIIFMTTLYSLLSVPLLFLLFGI